MDVLCPKCGASNRNTSRFCARCGETLPHAEEAEQSGSEAFELPWLQGVQERANKPTTEQLKEQQVEVEQTTPTPPVAPPAPIPQPSAADTGGTPAAQIDGGEQPSEQPPEQEEATPDVKAPIELRPTGSPNEPPPQWVVGILEPNAGAAPGAEQAYEPEELSHIMPWAHGESAGAGAQELPPWLGDVTVQETLQSAPAGSEPAAIDPSNLGLDDIEPFVPPATEEEEAEQGQAAAAARQEQQVPEWLRTLPGGEEQKETVPPDRSAQRREMFPEPTVTTTFVEPIARNVPVRSPRSGAVEALAALIQPTTGETTKRALPGAGLTTGLAAEAEARRGLRKWLMPDGIIYIAILAALLAVLLVRPPFGEVNAPAAPGVLEFYSMIESVPEQEPVLVVYDWDATRSAEMSILSEAVMRHLMSRRVRFVTVSTVPQGPGFAQQVTQSIVNGSGAGSGYEYGSDYLVLGYLPGNEAALRALVGNFAQAMPLDYQQRRPLNSYQLIQGSQIRSVSDFALIIDLASEEADLRNWIEQVSVRTNVPIIAAIPQGLDPLARPYTDLPIGGLKAVVSGPTGALQYNRQLELQGRVTASQAGMTNLTDRLNAQSVAQLLVAVVILAALVGLGSRRILRR
ncbi:MAG TPA: zinc ribbon domain-containing protein [Chloroflexia bacterium]|nr:zinc ribbon domain-containing protein [Chloroflexia bacterium]